MKSFLMLISMLICCCISIVITHNTFRAYCGWFVYILTTILPHAFHFTWIRSILLFHWFWMAISIHYKVIRLVKGQIRHWAFRSLRLVDWLCKEGFPSSPRTSHCRIVVTYIRFCANLCKRPIVKVFRSAHLRICRPYCKVIDVNGKVKELRDYDDFDHTRIELKRQQSCFYLLNEYVYIM